MTNSQRLATVRSRLRHWLAENRVEGESCEQTILRESILIRDEFYCGRRFHTPQHQAVWFIEEDELKIYRGNGELAAVFRGDEIDLDSHEKITDGPSVIKLSDVTPGGSHDQAASDESDRRAA